MSRVRREHDSNRKLWILLFVVIAVFCLIFFSARGRFSTPYTSRAMTMVISPFQRVASWVGDQAHWVTSNIWDIITVHEQNKMLRNEVAQLRVQNLQANEALAENERLRALWGYKQSAVKFDMVTARVIGRESDTGTRMIVINKGTMDGLEDDMPVVTEKGLVGRISEAGPYSSKVQLILDPRSSVGTLVQRGNSRVFGIVEGDSGNPFMPRMKNISRNADVEEGDMIVTSGFGGVYPKGIAVGTASKVENDGDGLLKHAVIETAVDFQTLEDVAVITASREAPPEPLVPPEQTPGTETNPTEPANAGGNGGAAN